MSTGYGWEGIRQVRCLVRAMYVSASAVGRAYTKGRYNKCSTFTFNHHLRTWFDLLNRAQNNPDSQLIIPKDHHDAFVVDQGRNRQRDPVTNS